MYICVNFNLAFSQLFRRCFLWTLQPESVLLNKKYIVVCGRVWRYGAWTIKCWKVWEIYMEGWKLLPLENRWGLVWTICPRRLSLVLFKWMIEFTHVRIDWIWWVKFVCFNLLWSWFCFRRILLCRKGDDQNNYLSIYLEAMQTANMSEGWSRDVKFNLFVFNQIKSNMTIRGGVILFPFRLLILEPFFYASKYLLDPFPYDFLVSLV